MDDIRAKIIFTDDGASANLNKVANAAKATGEAAKTGGVNVGQFGSTVGLAGQSIGRFNSGLGQTVTGAGAALGSIQAMTTAGFGPLGIALGIVTTAIGLGVTAYSAYVNAQQEAIDASKKLQETLNSTANSFDGVAAASRRARSEVSRDDRLARGEGTTQEFRDLEESRRRQLGALLAAGDADSAQFERINNERLFAQAQTTDEAIARRNAMRRAEEFVGNNDRRVQGETRTANARRGGRAGTDNTEASETALRQKQIDAEAAQRAQSDAMQEALKDGTRGSLRISGGAGKDAEGDGAQRGLELDQTLLESQVEREKAASESLKDIYKDTFGTLQAGIAASADAMINGGASAEQAGLMIVAALANQLSKVAMMEGLKEAALGIGSLASYDYPGAALHFAAAGAWTLVGAAAGVAGGALSSAAKPSGASGPSTGAGPAPRQQTASEEGARNVTINFAGGVITAATEAQLARTIRRTVSNTALGGT